MSKKKNNNLKNMKKKNKGIKNTKPLVFPSGDIITDYYLRFQDGEKENKVKIMVSNSGEIYVVLNVIIFYDEVELHAAVTAWSGGLSNRKALPELQIILPYSARRRV